MIPNLPAPPPQPQMPPMPQSLMGGMPQGGMNPHGGGEAPMCPCCGQPMPMPFNNTDTPQVPIDPRLMGLDGGQQGMQNPLLAALMGMGGGGDADQDMM